MNATGAYVIRAWDGDQDSLDKAAELYAIAFSEAPYNEHLQASRTSFRARVAKNTHTKPHFRLMLAWQQNALVGLAFGCGISAGDWWRDQVVPQLPDELSVTWFGDDAFAVEELAVAPAHRRGGVAASLLQNLLQDVPYSTAVLGAYADAVPARGFYRRHGWTEFASGIQVGRIELCLFGLQLSR